MRAVVAAAVTIFLVTAGAQPAAAKPVKVRCASIVVDRAAGPIRLKPIFATRTSCRVAHDVARRVMQDREDRRGSRRYRGFLCDLVSDRQIGCDRGRKRIRFDLA